MSAATSLTWFARHELRLAWREWLAMMTGGRRGRKRAAAIGLIIFAGITHLPAYAVIGRFANRIGGAKFSRWRGDMSVCFRPRLEKCQQSGKMLFRPTRTEKPRWWP